MQMHRTIPASGTYGVVPFVALFGGELRCVRDKHYLLTMDNVCLGLQNSIAVTVANGYDRVCSNDHAFVTYREFDQNRRCGILNVEEVEDREAALKLIERRKAPE